MDIKRIHIFGASGAGTTSLGLMLAERLECPHFDVDDYFWLPTDPPYTTKREPARRLEFLEADLSRHTPWVVSGSLCGWGDPVIEFFDLAVFLYVPTELRMARLKAREIERYGPEALAPGGRMHEHHREFIEWAESYDDADIRTRSIAMHEDWMKRLPCRLLRIEQDRPNDRRLAMILEAAGKG